MPDTGEDRVAFQRIEVPYGQYVTFPLNPHITLEMLGAFDFGPLYAAVEIEVCTGCIMGPHEPYRHGQSLAEWTIMRPGFHWIDGVTAVEVVWI